MPLQYKSPGVLLFSSPGVLAMGPNCCCDDPCENCDQTQINAGCCKCCTKLDGTDVLLELPESLTITITGAADANPDDPIDDEDCNCLGLNTTFIMTLIRPGDIIPTNCGILGGTGGGIDVGQVATRCYYSFGEPYEINGSGLVAPGGPVICVTSKPETTWLYTACLRVGIFVTNQTVTLTGHLHLEFVTGKAIAGQPEYFFVGPSNDHMSTSKVLSGECPTVASGLPLDLSTDVKVGYTPQCLVAGSNAQVSL